MVFLLGASRDLLSLQSAAARRLGVAGLGVDERLVHLDRRNDPRKYAAVGEEFTGFNGHVGPGQKPLERFLGDQGLIGRGADLGIGIVEQQDENGELFVRAGRQRALRREHPHVTRRFARLKKSRSGVVSITATPGTL